MQASLCICCLIEIPIFTSANDIETHELRLNRSSGSQHHKWIIVSALHFPRVRDHPRCFAAFTHRGEPGSSKEA
jgi:hypothetical protein